MAISSGVPVLPVSAVPVRERLLTAAIFITVLTSSIAFVEPSPHDALMGVLALAALIAGVRFDRLLAVPIMMLLIWNVSGLMSLTNVVGQPKTILYDGISIYLAVATVLWASLFAENTMHRLATMRVAYVITAVFSVFLGAAGYFHLFPDAFQLFTDYGRAKGAFKDPNVYGPFLIWPALFVVERMIARHIRIADAVVLAVLAFGLLLSFSRGAWFHFAVSMLVMVALAFVTASSHRYRLRIVVLTGLGLAALALFVAFLLSFHSIDQMFDIRAHLFQSYDIGQGGRFRLQELALGDVLKYPNGMGPFAFARQHGLQQHNVYLQALLVYGWVGAVGYLLLLFSTLTVGLRVALIRTPWQPYAITALAAFVGEMAEGFIIDSDHWRHFFLLIGMIWGMAVATRRYFRTPPVAPQMDGVWVDARAVAPP